MSKVVTVQARVYRYDPNADEQARFETYEVQGPEGLRILDVLRTIYEEQDPGLAFQYACRIGRCGTCSVRVNGRPVLACQERATPTVTIEPLSPFPVLRDLVVDRAEAERRYRQLALAPVRGGPHEGTPEPIDPGTAREIGVLGSCIACMICVSGCPAVEDRPFYGPAFMLQLRKLDQNPTDHEDRLGAAIGAGLNECYGCDACTQLCPADLSPADAIRGFRRDVFFPWPKRRRDDKGGGRS